MIRKHTLMFRLCLLEIDGHPDEVIKRISPPNAINTHWSSHPVGDQIWWWLEFKDETDKHEYECDVQGMDFFTTYQYRGKPRKMHVSNFLDKFDHITDEEFSQITNPKSE